MTNAVPVATSAVALQLVITAERLFALNGIEGVSLRQIATEAGTANNSAVHYHFGSKHGLIAAIFQHRLPQILNERKLLVARCDINDVRSLFEAHFLPVFAMAEAPDNSYVSFVEQLQRKELGADDPMLALPENGQRSTDEFRRQLTALLVEVPEPLRSIRIAYALSVCIHAAADRERAVAAGLTSLPFDLFVDVVLDGITGFLTAPESAATRRRLEQVGDLDIRGLRPF